MEEDFRALILGAAATVSWGERPQGGALPAIVLTGVSDTPTYHMDGDAGLTESRVQVDCYATTYGGAKAVERAITPALSGYRGVSGSTVFHGIFSEGARDLRDGGTDEAERLFRISIDFIVHHSEA